jgi:hypothetical protein
MTQFAEIVYDQNWFHQGDNSHPWLTERAIGSITDSLALHEIRAGKASLPPEEIPAYDESHLAERTAIENRLNTDAVSSVIDHFHASGCAAFKPTPRDK